jgi:hypothetical protein
MENAGSHQHLSKRQERHILRLGRELMLKRHPNPQRLGCPPKAELEAAAVNRALLPQAKIVSVIDHITICSQCFREFSRLRKIARLRKKLPVFLLTCSVLVAATVLAGEFLSRIWRHEQPKIIARARPGPLVRNAIVLDLRDQTRLRSDEPQVQRQTRHKLQLPRVPADLSIYLPIGSDEGKYTVQILRKDKEPLVTIEGNATMLNDVMDLQVRIDLQQFSVGDYVLALRQLSWPWSYYPLEIK